MKKQYVYIGLISIMLLVIIYSIIYTVLNFHRLTLDALFIIFGTVLGAGILVVIEFIFEYLDNEYSLKETKKITVINKISALSPIWLSPILYFLITLNVGNSNPSLFLMYLGVGISVIFFVYLSSSIFNLYRYGDLK